MELLKSKQKKGGDIMYCYDENEKFLGVVSCFPKEGEEHAWGDDVYICVGTTTDLGCKNGMIFNKIN
jgi:hypothetical protein